eukprot:UN06401
MILYQYSALWHTFLAHQLLHLWLLSDVSHQKVCLLVGIGVLNNRVHCLVREAND